MMRVHLLSYGLFVLVMFLFILATAFDSLTFTTIMLLAIEVTSFTAQMLLCFVFLTVATNSKAEDSSSDEEEASQDNLYEPLFKSRDYSEHDDKLL